MSNQELFAQFRRDYSGKPLDIQSVAGDPFTQFQKWFDEAVSSGVNEPNAMTLATADSKGVPSCRVVLLKSCDETGFTFFTNYNSHKGNDIESNPHVALLFFWQELTRQVRITGKVIKTSPQESDAYFISRPLRAQIAATLSPQSQVLRSSEKLSLQLESMIATDSQIKPVRPDHWGGFKVIPEEYEFWQGKPDRLHDRIRYRRVNNEWVIERLGP